MNLVVQGGYGNLGARISTALADDRAIQLMVAGRDAARAQVFAQPLGAAGVAVDSTDAHLAEQLHSLAADLAMAMQPRRPALMATILLARRLARGEPMPAGAQACMGLLRLPEFEPEFARWDMRTEVAEEPHAA